jgi:hypothetical protein
MQLGEHEPQFGLLIHDRDTKFSRAFEEIFRSEGIELIPDAGSSAERERVR